MRSSFSSRGGFVLTKSPNLRHQAARRRAAVLAAGVALAVASALVGAVVHPGSTASRAATTGPFSYISTE